MVTRQQGSLEDKTSLKPLCTPVQFVKGVGPRVSGLLSKIHLQTVLDLFFHFPHRYLDRSQIQHMSCLKPGDHALVIGKVQWVGQRYFRRGKKVFEVLFSDGTGFVVAKWFYFFKKSFEKRYEVGQSFLISGKVGYYGGKLQMVHPDCQTAIELGGGDGEILPPGVLPVYSCTEGLHPKLIRKIIKNVFEYYFAYLFETLPGDLRARYRLVSLLQAFQKLHMPEPSDLTQDFLSQRSLFHRRVIFEEFFFLELGLLKKRQGKKRNAGIAFKKDFTLCKLLEKKLSFELTADQKKVIGEIFKDMTDPFPMHRLLQGDVGSGKTIVALMAALLAFQNGYQVSIMVPTELLAEQHYQNWVRFLFPLNITPLLLTSSTPKAERKKIISLLQEKKGCVVIGTHALIEDEVEFSNLGLVVIDEQHRFGVRQRLKLMKKRTSKNPETYFPDVLVMTATPIPRSLAMTVYGDLDLSVMRQLPKGRMPVITKVLNEKSRKTLYRFLADQFSKGRQAYMVYPLVEESEKLALKNAQAALHTLTQEFPQFKVALVHGQMKEKEKVMQDFSRGKIQMLVATTVIEVGIDVPNATVMMIENAERFGLSQLHQLRGRVGRGGQASHCFLMADYKKTEVAWRRLRVMEETNDGFKISEEDLKIRGPGDFLGTRQSGLPLFSLANIVRDGEILTEARMAAKEVLEKDPDLIASEHREMKAYFETLKLSRSPFAGVG